MDGVVASRTPPSQEDQARPRSESGGTRRSWLRKYPRKASYPGLCSLCGASFPKGTRIAWAPHRPADHWNCYLMGQSTERTESTSRSFTQARWYSGSSRRTLSDQAVADQEAVKRGHEAYERRKRQT